MATQSPTAPSVSGGAPIFSVVLVFEDLVTRKRAKRAYEFLAANLAHEWQVVSQMWKFELLSNPELRKIAAGDAARANIIVVASRGDRELPAHVRNWIEMWLKRRGDAVALIALFDSPPAEAEPARATQAYLEHVAKRGHMEFFTWPELGLFHPFRRGDLIPDGRSEPADGRLLLWVGLAGREADCFHFDINE